MTGEAWGKASRFMPDEARFSHRPPLQAQGSAQAVLVLLEMSSLWRLGIEGKLHYPKDGTR